MHGREFERDEVGNRYKRVMFFLERLLPFLSQIVLTNLSESNVGVWVKAMVHDLESHFISYNLVYCVFF